MPVVDEAIFDVNTLTGLSSGNPITTWADTLGLHTATQASGTAPLYIPSVVNGYPVARFDLFKAMLTDMFPWSGPFTLTAVLRPASSATGLTIMGNGGANAGPQWRVDGLKQILLKQNTSGAMTSNRQTTTMSTSTFSVLTLKWVPASRYREAVTDRTNGYTVSTAGIRATNGDATTFWEALTVASGTPAWLRMTPLTATAHTAYTISPYNTSNSAPKDFKLQGSMDASSWTDLDTRTGETWATLTPRTYTFSNSTAYTYYRLLVSATVVGTTLAITDVQLGSTALRTGHFVSFLNSKVNGWGVVDVDQHVEFLETAAWQISNGRDAGERFNGDIAYLHLKKGEIDDSAILSEHATLATRFAISTAISTITGSVSASSEYPTETAAMGADGSTTTFWTTNAVVAATYQFALPSPLVVASYSVTRRPEPWQTRNIKDWTFQGSNNGTSWTTLDTRTGVTWPTAGLEVKTFTFSNTTPYLLYRLNITANNGDASYTSFTEAWLNLDGSQVPAQQLPLNRLTGPVYNTSWRLMYLTDGVIGGAGNSWSALVGPPGTLTAGTTEASTITSYTFVARTEAGTSVPVTWTFQGSNDGSTWTTLDTRTGLPTWANGETRTFQVSGAAAYTQYRWVFTATPASNFPSFTELYTYTGGISGGSTPSALGFWGILQATSTTSSPPAGGQIVTDTFNRADTTTSLGTTSDGLQAWTYSGAGSSAFRVLSNQLLGIPQGSRSFALVSAGTGVVNYTVVATQKIAGASNGGLVLRLTDGNNYYCAKATATGYEIWRRVFGSNWDRISAAGTVVPAVGDVVEFSASGSALTLKVNGVTAATASDGFMTSGLVGFMQDNATPAIGYDDFSVQ
jgi:hypothetical protein